MIELSHVGKVYQGREGEVHALRDISLQISEGEFVSIIGSSGSGKSTLMNILGCLDEATEGTYTLFGRPVKGLRGRTMARVRNREIGFVFQHFNLVSGLTAFRNVELPLILRGEKPAVRREKTQAALAGVGLSQRQGHLPAQLSGGQQQRVAIARALVTDPRLILADEPTGNLDGPSSDAVMSLLTDIHAAGRTVVLITHDPAVAARADRIIRIENGRIIPF